jgi:3D domain
MPIRISALAALAALAAAATLGTPPAGATGGCPPRPPDTARRITQPRWLSGAVVTEYYPVREQWFDGKAASVPGLAGRHRLDWLYGPHGVAMNGEGVGRDDRFYHFAGPYDIGWVNEDGALTSGCWNGRWTNGRPAWLDLGWRNRSGQVTYPLAGSGWSNGAGRRYVPPPASLRFEPGRSTLPFWRTVAVDPHVVPLGSRVFIPAYCHTPAHGWFRALDTGGAIIGYHFDVYRAPPPTLQLRSHRGQHVFVLPPGTRLRARTGARCG